MAPSRSVSVRVCVGGGVLVVGRAGVPDERFHGLPFTRTRVSTVSSPLFPDDFRSIFYLFRANFRNTWHE